MVRLYGLPGAVHIYATQRNGDRSSAFLSVDARPGGFVAPPPRVAYCTAIEQPYTYYCTAIERCVHGDPLLLAPRGGVGVVDIVVRVLRVTATERSSACFPDRSITPGSQFFVHVRCAS
jgi:hypothetical protein